MVVGQSVYHSAPSKTVAEVLALEGKREPGSHHQTKDAGERAEIASERTEFDPGYHGWRLVLAACLGVMAGFGSLFDYTLSLIHISSLFIILADVLLVRLIQVFFP